MLWAIGLIGAFYLMTLVLGFGAAALLDTGAGQRGRRRPAATWPRRCSPRRSAAATGTTGGAVLLALISAVAFATILAVVAGLTLTSASSVAHDLYANVFKKGAGDREGGGPGGPDRGVRHRRHRDRAGHPGAEAEHRLPGGAGLRGRGLGQPAVDPLQPVLAAVQHPRRRVGDLRRPDRLRGPGVLLAGRVRARNRDRRCSPTSDWSWFPLQNPGIVSIPLGFFFGWLGTVTSKEPEAEERYTELEVRALTGAGAEAGGRSTEATAPATVRPDRATGRRPARDASARRLGDRRRQPRLATS